MEKFEYKGIWWTPENPDHRVPGIIKFDPIEGAMLDTIAENFLREFRPAEGTENESLRMGTFAPEQNLICGFTEKGDAVSLYKCRYMGEVWATGYVGSRVKVQVVFVGHHFHKEEDIAFESVVVSYSKLDKWVGIGAFDWEATRDKSGRYRNIKLDYKLPDRIEAHTPELTIAIDFHVGFDPYKFGEFHTKQTTSIELTPHKALTYQKYHSDILYQIRNLLSLGTQSTLIPLMLRGKNKNHKTQLPNGEIYLGETSCFYVAKGSNVPLNEHINIDMLFGLADLSGNLDLYLTNWFAKFEKLRHIHDLYFGIFYIPSMYVHLEFLTLAQVLEVYHRLMYEGTYIAAPDFKIVRKALTKAIPKTVTKDSRQIFTDKINFLNEYTLRTRLNLILQETLKELDDLIQLITKDQKNFVDKIVQTRNYLTHYSKQSEKKALTDPNELYQYSQKMKLIIQLCFLVEMGIPSAKIRDMVSNNTSFNS